MKKIAIGSLVSALLAITTVYAVEDKKESPAMPQPAPEHEWLMQLVGDWDANFETTTESGKPAETSRGTESVRKIGGFWVVADYNGAHMGAPFTGAFTLGYDPEKKKYIGTWIDSMSSHLWTFKGTLDETGKILTLECEGPCPGAPGKMVKFKDRMELKSKDERVFTSTMQDESGKWITGMTIHYQRK